jgi:hypothetical protein
MKIGVKGHDFVKYYGQIWLAIVVVDHLLLEKHFGQIWMEEVVVVDH